jgi:D-amino-acid oxidase
MAERIAVIGAGVSGLTCAVLFAERGHRTAIWAEETGRRTTSGAAAALWFPYDAEPIEKVIKWALATYNVLVDLAHDRQSGVSFIELRSCSRSNEIQIPDWAAMLGACAVPRSSESAQSGVFPSAFQMRVPLMDTSIYLDYLARRFRNARGEIHGNIRFEQLEDVDPAFELVINCAGIGARELAPDRDLEPHRGQVAIVATIDNLNYAIACDEAPLTYAIPRTNDCVFGGTNAVSDNRNIDPIATSKIVAECARVLNIDKPKVLAERVGLRPFRRSGVRVEHEQLRDGRTLIHNYGHGGSGFTLSWGCANEVLEISNSLASERQTLG